MANILSVSFSFCLPKYRVKLYKPAPYLVAAPLLSHYVLASYANMVSCCKLPKKIKRYWKPTFLCVRVSCDCLLGRPGATTVFQLWGMPMLSHEGYTKWAINGEPPACGRLAVWIHKFTSRDMHFFFSLSPSDRRNFLMCLYFLHFLNMRKL